MIPNMQAEELNLGESPEFESEINRPATQQRHHQCLFEFFVSGASAAAG